MVAERFGGCHNGSNLASLQQVERPPPVQSAARPEDEGLLHPGIEVGHPAGYRFQAFDCSFRPELPCRIQESMPPGIEREQLAQLPSPVDCLPGQLKLLSDLVGAKGAAPFLQQPLPLAKPLQARGRQEVVEGQRFDGLRLLQGPHEHAHIAALGRRLGHRVGPGGRDDAGDAAHGPRGDDSPHWVALSAHQVSRARQRALGLSLFAAGDPDQPRRHPEGEVPVGVRHADERDGVLIGKNLPLADFHASGRLEREVRVAKGKAHQPVATLQAANLDPPPHTRPRERTGRLVQLRPQRLNRRFCRSCRLHHGKPLYRLHYIDTVIFGKVTSPWLVPCRPSRLGLSPCRNEASSAIVGTSTPPVVCYRLALRTESAEQRRVSRSPLVITKYIAEALHRARCSVVDGGTFCATVPGLPGVIATGTSLEACRDKLAEVVEEWILVRVARGLSIPRLGTARVQVRRAS